MMSTDTLSQTFAALAHPTRRAILARLHEGEASVQDLARPFKLSGPAMTKHLKVLEQSGLISRSRKAQFRPCRMEAAPLKAASEWIEQYRQEWEQRFDRLESYLQEIQQPQTPKKGRKS